MIELDFSKLGGLVPAIAQDDRTGEVLMVAFMNKEAWERTLQTGIVHYFSRTRNELWKKGETSGNVQLVKEIRIDCDNDAVLIKVHQVGDVACHTGYRSCFYRVLEGSSLKIDGWKKE
ncbi:MAG: phosphoribosyl-AMP cyclohydrolase [Spirochaetes bacterium]|nr:phosphoribosyl-AMP cyclohydrolase [Spirochaetota bacterium]